MSGNIPTPEGFGSWQEWAERLLETLESGLGAGSSVAPSIPTNSPNPPPDPTPDPDPDPQPSDPPAAITLKHLVLQPAAATAPQDSFSALVLSTEIFDSIDVAGRFKIVSQLRTGSSPAADETMWVYFAYTDATQHYFVKFKTDGWELGKADPAYASGLRPLSSGTFPVFAVGSEHSFRVTNVDASIDLYADGVLISSFLDEERPYDTGKVGLYANNAEVQFDNLSGSVADSFESYALQTLGVGAIFGDFQVESNGGGAVTIEEIPGDPTDPTDPPPPGSNIILSAVRGLYASVGRDAALNYLAASTLPSFSSGTEGELRPTFHCMSIYWNPQSAPGVNRTPISESGHQWVYVQYRKQSSGVWKDAYPLFFDPRTSGTGLPYAYRARGSVVNLAPGTVYVFRLGLMVNGSIVWYRQVTGSTWSETFPEGTVVPVNDGTTLSITTSGSPTAYRVYDGDQGGGVKALLEVSSNVNNSSCIFVNADYVIIRNIHVKGGFRYGIRVASNRHHIVIEDNEIEDWDWNAGGTIAGWGTWGENEIGAVDLQSNNSQIVVQRNRIHDPHFGAHPWDYGHPRGPQGIELRNGGRQNVFRYNEFWCGNGDGNQSVRKWFNDVLGGCCNFSTTGYPGSDSDIYQNILLNAMDDSIEAEGGGMNVRIWGNYCSWFLCCIATTHAAYGPLYSWRNIGDRQRGHHNDQPDNDGDRGKWNKAGGQGGGRRYFWHNTALQTPGSFYTPAQSDTLGAGQFVSATGDGQGLKQTFVENNIAFAQSATSMSSRTGDDGSNVFRNNFRNGSYHSTITSIYGTAAGVGDAVVANTTQPTWVSGHGYTSTPWAGGPASPAREANFQIQSGSTGSNIGRVIPNFNDGFAGAAPDPGAHEFGDDPMTFGITAVTIVPDP